MEQNKVLMVIVSVAIFFAAIIGVGVALLYPRAGETAQASADGIVREFDPIEYVRRPETAPLEAPEDSEEPMIIVYGDAEDTPPAEEADDGGQGAAEEPVVRERPARVVQPDTSEPTAEAPDPAPQPEAGEPAAPPVSAAPTERAPQPRQIRVTEYWIQLIASPNRDRVEQAQTTLADYSLGGRVTTKDVDGQMFYRLRVGPYESQSEAEKFLEWIQNIDGFSGAYVSEEYPLRTVTS